MKIILIEEMKYEQAHTLLGSDPDNYQHIELKGDLHYLQNNDDEALSVGTDPDWRTA